MESFNKVLYFILGLVVVLVFVIVFTGRLNLGKTFKPLATTTTPTPTPKGQPQKGFLSFLGQKQEPTPTPTMAVQPTVTPQMADQTGASYSKGQQQPAMQQTQPVMQQTKGGTMTKAQTIPATGSPVEILYLAVPTLLTGFSLRKRK